jgi:HPt (histidine-containing phosphotransfer) domain-containing protein
VNLVKKPETKKTSVGTKVASVENQKITYTDLSYLMKRTKSNPELMCEMITLYLEQTPALIKVMKQSLLHNDWDLLYSAAHKMIPSFAIMGIDSHYEGLAKKIQEFAKSRQQTDGIYNLVLQLEKMCDDVCIELSESMNELNNKKI